MPFRHPLMNLLNDGYWSLILRSFIRSQTPTISQMYSREGNALYHVYNNQLYRCLSAGHIQLQQASTAIDTICLG